MRISFITSSFNGMAQRLWVELDRRDHEVKVEIFTSAEKIIESIDKYAPDVIIAPFLMSKIPPAVWKNYLCLIVHPGIIGDRGASSLDWAILNEEKEWGVTILEAVEKMDAGPVWSSFTFPMRNVSKAALYRNEVTQAAAKGVIEALANFERENFVPIQVEGSDECVKGKWNRKTSQNDYAFLWTESTLAIIKKIRAADSAPGVITQIIDKPYYCYGVHPETKLTGDPGDVLAQRDAAICIATGDGAVWITHLKATADENVKLPAILAIPQHAKSISASKCSPFDNVSVQTWQEIRFELIDNVGYLHFNFYNGAMSTDQCNRLRGAFVEAQKRTKLIVLLGGEDVWSNGIHLNVIEHADDPAKESWDNINAIDNLILEIINATDHYVICALQGNAGAGGVALALAGDKVISRNGIVLNPHTKNMGLFGSEYWTYLLPKRIGLEKAEKFTEECLPWGVAVAKEIGLIDDFAGQTNNEFRQFVNEEASRIVNLSYFDKLILAKKVRRRKDEMNKPLSEYRENELRRMKVNFYENNLQYHEKRFAFVHKSKQVDSAGIQNLYQSRRSIYRKRKWESIDYREDK